MRVSRRAVSRSASREEESASCEVGERATTRGRDEADLLIPACCMRINMGQDVCRERKARRGCAGRGRARDEEEDEDAPNGYVVTSLGGHRSHSTISDARCALRSSPSSSNAVVLRSRRALSYSSTRYPTLARGTTWMRAPRPSLLGVPSRRMGDRVRQMSLHRTKHSLCSSPPPEPARNRSECGGRNRAASRTATPLKHE